MDRRVKERLVGASILVVLIVLIVPELLSGPAPAPVGPRPPVSAPEPVRNVTVDLATAKAPALEPAMDPVATGASAASAAAGSGVVPDTGAAQGAGATVPPQAAPPAAAPSSAAGAQRAASSEPLESAAPAPTTPAAAAVAKPAAAHGWAVQLGSFASRANADKLARQVKGQGFSVFVLPGGSGAAQRYRVRIGPLADRTAAAQTEAKLKALGHMGTVVSPAT
jgi:DedD protein